MKLKLKNEDAPDKAVNLTLNSKYGKKTITLRIKPSKRRFSLPAAYAEPSQAAQPPSNVSVNVGYASPYNAPLQQQQMQKQQVTQPEEPVHFIKTEEPVEIEEKVKGGFKIPDILTSPAGEDYVSDKEEITRINITYPLIPHDPKEGGRVFAYAHIYFDRKSNETVYDVIEPQLDDRSRMVLEDIKDYIREKIDINFAHVRGSATDYINNIFSSAMKYFNIKSKETEEVLKYYVIRDFIGLEKIEPFLSDRQIEDISCDGVDIPLYVYHRDPRLGSLRTNVFFTNREGLDSFASKLGERCGKVISVAKPLLDGTLPDGSRVQATLGSDIAQHGSNFTIRMFTEKPLTPVDMIKFGTCDTKMLSYLWFLIEHNQSILISGGTATGKTSLLNVLSLFIKPQMKIVSIEDTPEIRLPHSHWVPEVARTAISEEGKVDMYELLRESLRQRPDYIIVGEVRGREAYVLFQQLAVGHAGMATVHAENFAKLMDRLSTPPISLPVNLIQNIDVIIFIKRVKQDRVYKRRIASVTEVIGYNRKENTILTNEVMRWDPKTDKYVIANKSALLKKVSDMTGLTEGEIDEDIKRKAAVINWITEKKVSDYSKVGLVFNLFYNTPDLLMQRIGYA